jgi:pyruvate/2-oxoglutarate dehydrogenase complex dihydrolipoamide dehydrogenase (E3) component
MAHYDCLVIGSGQAGPALAVRLAKSGLKTAIVERNRIGGTCVNVGCIPTKALVASARVAHVVQNARAFGVHVDAPMRVDMAEVQARMDQIRSTSNRSVTRWLEDTPGLRLIHGHARFESPHEVNVAGEVLKADRIFLNVGGRASVPETPGLAGIDYLTNSSILEVKVLPEHLVILGGSYIGLEFAQMFRRFGSKVSVLELAPRLIAREDPDVSAAVAAILQKEGIEIHTGVTKLQFERGSYAGSQTGLGAHFETAKGPVEIEGSHCLVAVGRRPNTDDLALERAGVLTDARGYIVVDDTLATNVPHIFALGDVNGRGAFTHTAYNDYEIVADNLLDQATRRVSDRISAYALFIDPPLARIGLSAEGARKTGRTILRARMAMERVGRARERSETDGFMEILVDAATEEILGATLLGIEADEAIHSILDLMSARASFRVLQHTVHIHPTVSELLPTLVGDLKPLDS